MNESTIQQHIRLGISAPGCRMFRNNVGEAWTGNRVVKNRDGSITIHNPRRFHAGLCKGSSDLIGWQTRDIEGERVAVFTAIEVKGPRTTVRDNQQRFIDTVTRAGGIAGIARSLDDAREILLTK